MKKIKFDRSEIEIIMSLVSRKIEKLKEKEVDEFNIQYEQSLQQLLEKLQKIVYTENMTEIN